MLKLMVVDDEKAARDSMIQCVQDKKNGFEIVCTAEDGFDALRKIEDFRPDIVLMDIEMPGMTGLQVIAEVQERGMHPVFIIISSYGEFAFAQEALRLGVKDYLLKPFMPSDLYTSVLNAAKKILPPEIIPYVTDETEEGTVGTSFHPFGRKKEFMVYPFEEEEAVMTACNTGTQEEAIAMAEQFFQRAEKENPTEKMRINCAAVLFIEIYHLALNIGLDMSEFHVASTISNVTSLNIIHDIIQHLIERVCEKVLSRRGHAVAAVRASEFIKQHYQENLSLDYVAAQVFVSPSYLSSLFRQTFGMCFIDYIHSVRIENAKRLLREQPHLKNYEVSNLLGYSSDKYFSQIFKKLCHITVNQYRLQVVSGTQNPEEE